MGHNVIETVMGAVVLTVAALFIYFAFQTVQVGTPSGYQISGSFFRIGGLNVGSEVRVSGLKVGRVEGRHLDPETYDAVVLMTVEDAVKLPVDTVATIVSAGPLGGKYVRLIPGQSEQMLANGDTLAKTESFKSLEDQVGEIIFLATSKPD